MIPGGLLPLILLLLRGSANAGRFCVTRAGGAQTCTGGPSTAYEIRTFVTIALALVLPFVTAVYLARRAQCPTAG